MSGLIGRINEATTTAMKARDKARVAVLRLINAELKRVAVDERRELGDADVLTVLNRMLKQRNDAQSQFAAAGRNDLAEKEGYEIGVITEFMPEPLAEDELDERIRGVIASTGATSMRDMGKVMAALKETVAGRADLAAVSARVRALLG
jgi:uncharacterized protein YqeY